MVLIESHSRVSIAAFCVMLISFLGYQKLHYESSLFWLISAVSQFLHFGCRLPRTRTNVEQLLTATGRTDTYVAAWQVATENFQTVMIGVGYCVEVGWSSQIFKRQD